jgi:hypothetical protein
MDAVASIEDEGLHLGVPALGLVPEMNTGIQQFLYTYTNHNFPFVISSGFQRSHPAEHGIVL